MSNAQHTPGPWVADPAGTIRAECTAQPLPFAVAVVLGDADVGKGRGAANARLIAAAPELLAIVSKLAYLADGLDNCNSGAEEAASRLAHEAQAAIAKATGSAA